MSLVKNLFTAGIGAEAVLEMLKNLDLELEKKILKIISKKQNLKSMKKEQLKDLN